MSTLGARRPASILLCAAWLAGCGGKSTTPTTPPTISPFQAVGFDNASDTLGIGDTLRLSGKSTDNQGLASWNLTILDLTGQTIDTVRASSVSGGNFSFDQPNLNLLVHNDGSWGSTGAYTVRLTVTNTKGIAAHVDLTILATGTGSSTTLVSQGGREIGAPASSLGSFLDLTRDSVWKSGPIPYSHIDIVFGMDGNGKLALMSPSGAISEGLDLNGWTTLNATSIIYSAAPLRNSGALKAAIEGTSLLSQKTAAQIGWYAVKLVTGAYVALDVTSLSGTDSTATATVEIFR